MLFTLEQTNIPIDLLNEATGDDRRLLIQECKTLRSQDAGRRSVAGTGRGSFASFTGDLCQDAELPLS